MKNNLFRSGEKEKKFSTMNLSSQLRGSESRSRQGSSNMLVINRKPSKSTRMIKTTKAPTPVDLPSMRSEHAGMDPNVALVPSGGSGWASSDRAGKLSTLTTSGTVAPEEAAAASTSQPADAAAAQPTASAETTVPESGDAKPSADGTSAEATAVASGSTEASESSASAAGTGGKDKAAAVVQASAWHSQPRVLQEALLAEKRRQEQRKARSERRGDEEFPELGTEPAPSGRQDDDQEYRRPEHSSFRPQTIPPPHVLRRTVAGNEDRPAQSHGGSADDDAWDERYIDRSGSGGAPSFSRSDVRYHSQDVRQSQRPGASAYPSMPPTRQNQQHPSSAGSSSVPGMSGTAGSATTNASAASSSTAASGGGTASASQRSGYPKMPTDAPRAPLPIHHGWERREREREREQRERENRRNRREHHREHREHRQHHDAGEEWRDQHQHQHSSSDAQNPPTQQQQSSVSMGLPPPVRVLQRPDSADGVKPPNSSGSVIVTKDAGGPPTLNDVSLRISVSRSKGAASAVDDEAEKSQSVEEDGAMGRSVRVENSVQRHDRSTADGFPPAASKSRDPERARDSAAPLPPPPANAWKGAVPESVVSGKKDSPAADDSAEHTQPPPSEPSQPDVAERTGKAKPTEDDVKPAKSTPSASAALPAKLPQPKKPVDQVAPTPSTTATTAPVPSVPSASTSSSAAASTSASALASTAGSASTASALQQLGNGAGLPGIPVLPFPPSNWSTGGSNASRGGSSTGASAGGSAVQIQAMYGSMNGGQYQFSLPQQNVSQGSMMMFPLYGGAGWDQSSSNAVGQAEWSTFGNFQLGGAGPFYNPYSQQQQHSQHSQHSHSHSQSQHSRGHYDHSHRQQSHQSHQSHQSQQHHGYSNSNAIGASRQQTSGYASHTAHHQHSSHSAHSAHSAHAQSYANSAVPPSDGSLDVLWGPNRSVNSKAFTGAGRSTGSSVLPADVPAKPIAAAPEEEKAVSAATAEKSASASSANNAAAAEKRTADRPHHSSRSSAPPKSKPTASGLSEMSASADGDAAPTSQSRSRGSRHSKSADGKRSNDGKRSGKPGKDQRTSKPAKDGADQKSAKDAAGAKPAKEGKDTASKPRRGGRNSNNTRRGGGASQTSEDTEASRPARRGGGSRKVDRKSGEGGDAKPRVHSESSSSTRGRGGGAGGRGRGRGRGGARGRPHQADASA